MIIGKSRTNQPVEDEGKVDARIESLVEGGTLDNAKPIYYHGLEIYNTEEPYEVIQMHILNNDPTPFTLTTLRQWFTNISGAVRGQCNGCIKLANEYMVPYVLYKNATDNLFVYGTAPSGMKSFEIDLSTYFDGVLDAVNKIN